MNFLETLTEDQRRTVVRLPYRIGLWIAHSDAKGGTQAQEAEQQALANIIRGFSDEVFASENIQYIMMAATEQQSDWVGWCADLDDIPHECRLALDILGDHWDQKDLTALRGVLMEIAEAVAMAFAERTGEGILSKMALLWDFQMFRLTHKGKLAHLAGSLGTFQSISPKERRALERLAGALKG